MQNREKTMINPGNNTMRNIIASYAVICLLTAVSVSAAEYEFYKGCQYPGKNLRPGVGVNKVVEAGGKPQEYARRTVQWWPRKGHDVVEVTKGMPLRTWTFRSSDHMFSQYGKVKAHLIGFRGVGAIPHTEPCVVLRLPDGRKRMLPGGTFAQADRDFIMKVFEGEMKRIDKNRAKIKYKARDDINKSYPNIAKPGQPGTMQVQTEHIVWASGSQSGDSGDPWIREKNLAAGKRYRDEVMTWSENMWILYEYSGNLMCGWDRKEQHKYLITVPGTKRDGFKYISVTPAAATADAVSRAPTDGCSPTSGDTVCALTPLTSAAARPVRTPARRSVSPDREATTRRAAPSGTFSAAWADTGSPLSIT